MKSPISSRSWSSRRSLGTRSMLLSMISFASIDLRCDRTSSMRIVPASSWAFSAEMGKGFLSLDGAEPSDVRLCPQEHRVLGLRILPAGAVLHDTDAEHAGLGVQGHREHLLGDRKSTRLNS